MKLILGQQKRKPAEFNPNADIKFFRFTFYNAYHGRHLPRLRIWALYTIIRLNHQKSSLIGKAP